MQNTPPFDQIGQANPGPYINASPSSGVRGSIINADFFNQVQAELLAIIAEAGLTPSSADLKQAMRALRGGQLWTFTDAGTAANALVINPTTPHTALLKGVPFRVFPAFSNTQAGPTLKIGATTGLSAVLKRRDQSDLAAGDIIAGIPFDCVYDGTYARVMSVVASEFSAAISSSTTISQSVLNLINSLTPRGSTKLAQFTGGLILNDISSSGFSTTQTTGGFSGASFIDVSATCALRDLAGTGTEGGGTARLRLNDLTAGTTSDSNYVGGGSYTQNNQVPLVVPRFIYDTIPAHAYNLSLVVQKGTSDGQVQTYDAYIFVQHDGTNS